MTQGKVYLVGAGPGDPGLLTLKGMECIREADVIVYDRLVHPSILAHARPDAELIYVGKESSAHTMKQEDINRLLCGKALEGKTIVRLKGGDPFVFGRGGEEAEHLVERGVPFEVVPGVTSAIAVPAYAGIPITHRGVARSFCVITGHERENGGKEERKKGRREELGLPINHQPSTIPSAQSKIQNPKSKIPETLVFLMGVENLAGIVSELIANGRDPSTPIALIRWGTWPEQETLVGTLETICAEVERTGFKPPAVTIVGDVVKLRDKLRWFDNRPLFGKKVLVTRTRDQASALSDLLRRYGADPIEFPVIKIVPPASFAELDQALDRIGEYDWLLFTSANGVRAVMDRLEALGRDVRSLKGPKIGAIGPATADAVRGLGMRVDFVPSEFVAEAVAHEFPEDPAGKHILVPRAKEAREVLPEKLIERGARVHVATAYETVIEDSDVPRIRGLLDKGEIDIVTFTSSSTVTNFVKLIGASIPATVKIACIGPITAQTAQESGLHPDIMADDYTIEGLVEALLE